MGAFFFIVMNQVFGNLSAVELFIKERAIFMQETIFYLNTISEMKKKLSMHLDCFISQ